MQYYAIAAKPAVAKSEKICGGDEASGTEQM
jgi:hypothetical protein